jgi:hypothetical protein
MLKRLAALVLSAAFLATFAAHGWSHPTADRDCAACAVGQAGHVAADAPSVQQSFTAPEEPAPRSLERACEGFVLPGRGRSPPR